MEIEAKQIPSAEELAMQFDTMAGRIRKLDSLGLTRYQISKHLDIKYQWVRNVLITKVKNPKEKV